MATNLKVSKHIEDFVKFYNTAKSHYTYCRNKVNECDKLTQDLLHKLELDSIDRNEKSRITTQLKYCRKDRRYYKDRVEELEPFVKLFEDDKSSNSGQLNTRAVNQISNSLGQVRKQEEYHNNRTYKPRIIKDETTDVR